MSLIERNRLKLERLIAEHQFTHASPYLIENTRQGIRCEKAGTADYRLPGGSRIGGDPDLAPAFEWPLTSDGIPMSFLVQLNLQELTKHDDSSLLPANGILYFFVGIDEPAYNIEHRVVLVPDGQVPFLQRRSSPENTALEEQFNGYQLKARASLEPPNYVYVDDEQIENEEVDHDDYDDLCQVLSDSHRDDVVLLFGYPTSQHDDCEHEAALMMLTGKEYGYNKNEALQQLTDHFAGDKEKAEQEIQDTLLLLELESDDAVGFCWWDCGVLQFFIRKEDLLAERFDRTYCSLYSS